MHRAAGSVTKMLVLLLALAPGFRLTAQELSFTHFLPEGEVNPLPSTDIRSVYQDRLGFIWLVAYSSGILRYDGHQMERYTTADGLPGLDVRDITEDREGRLWVSSDEGVVVTPRPLGAYGTHERLRFADSLSGVRLPRSAITEYRLISDTAGRIWIGTGGSGIVRYTISPDGKAGTDTLRTGDDTKNREVRSLHVSTDGTVTCAVGGGLLLVFSPQSPTPWAIGPEAGLPTANTEVMRQLRDGTLLGGCTNGAVWRLTGTRGSAQVDIVSSTLKSRVTTITETAQGAVWIGSEGSGILHYPRGIGSPAVHYGKRNGLPSEIISRILEDREHNIWIAQVGGVSRLRLNFSAFRNYSGTSYGGEAPYLPSPGVNVVIPQNGTNGDLWVATSGGGVVSIRENGDAARLLADQGLRNNWVNGLAIDERGRLWIGTSGGVNCLSFDEKAPPPASGPRRRVTIGERQGMLASYTNTTIYTCTSLPLPAGGQTAGSVEAIWLSGYQHLYCIIGNDWYAFPTASGLPPTYFTVVTLDDEGRLLVGTRDAGLWRSKAPLTAERIRSFRSEPFISTPDMNRLGREIVDTVFAKIWDEAAGAPSNQFETLYWDHGALWAGTPEGLLQLTLDPLRIATHLTVADGLPGNDVTSIAYAPATRTLWAGTNGGLAEVDIAGRKVSRVVTKQNGIVGNEVWFYGSVSVARDGSVNFGTSKGLSVYSPQLDALNTLPPIVVLRSISFRQSSTQDNEFNLEYAALSFAAEKYVRYKTRLIGFDADWSEENSDVKIRYTNLSAFMFDKAYTFQVVASNNDHVWTETPVSFSFNVSPPWWFRWWWLLLNLVILVLTVFAALRYRTAHLERRGRELQQLVDERTLEIRRQSDELAGKNVELEEKNKEIIRTQEQLVMQEKLASLGALTAGIAHEIKNPLNFVNNFAELSVELLQDLRSDLAAQKELLDPKALQRLEETIQDLEHNSTKINEHGKRADSIVRGMLLHSRGKSGERLPTDLNALVDEYVNLAYHGLRAQDASFNIAIKTDYDPSVGEMNVVTQDLSRVILNIVNNACYAANERKKSAPADFAPTIWVSTKVVGKDVEVRIRDNGTGIPKAVVDRIFEPFFTTKPTGKGTGLGLSLSYDIIVKQHNGGLRVETKEGEFTEFIIRLPR